MQNSSASPPTQGQSQQPTSSLDAHAAHGASPFQTNIPEILAHRASPQINPEQNPSLNDLPSQPPGVDDKPRCVTEEGDNSEGSTEHHAKLVVHDVSSEKEVTQLEHERLTELVRQPSATLAAQTERDRRVVQLTEELVQKSALLEQAEANVAEAKRRAGLEQREMQAKLGELLLSRDHATEANENLQRCVPSSRRASPNWQQSIYDSRALRVVGPRAKQRETHRAPRLRQIWSIRMRRVSRVGSWNVCKL